MKISMIFIGKRMSENHLKWFIRKKRAINAQVIKVFFFLLFIFKIRMSNLIQVKGTKIYGARPKLTLVK